MHTRRLLAAFGAPLVLIACATGSAPIGGGSAGDGGSSGGSDASYGAEDGGTDSGASGKDSGARGIEGGVTPDSGGGSGGGGGDCSGSSDSIGITYNDLCEYSFGGDGTCTPGGTDCPSGDCCFSDNASACFTDYGPTCVPQ